MEDRQGMDMETVQREWLKAGDASRLSGLGRTTLWKLASTRQIQAAKVGKAVRFSRKSLEDFMEKSSYPKAR
jgi:excisionase family DNA binding protein